MEERKIKKKRGCLIAFGIVFLIIIVAIIIGSMNQGEKEPTPIKTETETETKKPSQKATLELQSISWQVQNNRQVITSCYVRNRTDRQWKDSVDVKITDLKGGAIFSSFDCAWPEMSVPDDKGETQSWLGCKIQGNKTLMRWGQEYKLVWRWGSQTWTARVKYEEGSQSFE